MDRYKIVSFVLFVLTVFVFPQMLNASIQHGEASYDIQPRPQTLKKINGMPFRLNASTRITYSQDNLKEHEAAMLLANHIREATGLDIKVTHTLWGNNVIMLKVSKNKMDSKKSYAVSVNSKRIVIKANNEIGLVEALATFRQMLPLDTNRKLVFFPPVEIKHTLKAIPTDNSLCH